MGAWIEIDLQCPKNRLQPSLPSWERGLKFTSLTVLTVLTVVAPLVGAWIEIMCVTSLER